MSLIHKLLVTLGIRKKSPPDTFVLASIDLVDDGLGNMVTPAVIRRRGNRVFISDGKRYVGGKQVPPAPMPSAAPPMRKRLDPQPSNQPVDPTMPFYASQLAVHKDFQSCEPAADFTKAAADELRGNGGEFSGAGSSGSWDSSSSCSSDTSSSSSDSGSSSCGSD